MSEFNPGDKVRCKCAGCPIMVINAPTQVINYNNINGVQNGEPAAWFTCVWWNVNTQMFNQFCFHEDALEAIID